MFYFIFWLGNEWKAMALPPYMFRHFSTKQHNLEENAGVLSKLTEHIDIYEQYALHGNKNNNDGSVLNTQ